MKLEITIRIKVADTQNIQSRLQDLMDEIRESIWRTFENTLQLDSEPPVTVAWSDLDEAKGESKKSEN